MKDGPMLKQFHSRRGKAWKRFAAYAYRIFKPTYRKYMYRKNGHWIYKTATIPRLFVTVPKLNPISPA